MEVVTTVGKVVLAIGLNYGVHYGAMAAHNWMCIPHTLKEIAQSMFATASPACSTLMVVGQHTQSAYATAIAVGLAGVVTTALKAVA